MKFKDARFIQGFRFPSHLEHLKNPLPASADAQVDSLAEKGEKCSQESGMQGSAFLDEKDRSAEQNRLKQEEGSSAEQEEEDEDEDEDAGEKEDFYPSGITDLTQEGLPSNVLTSECESLWWSNSLILPILSQK